MQAPKRIVVGVDLSNGEIGEGSRLALEQARLLALDSGSHVTILHSAHADEYWADDAKRFDWSVNTVDSRHHGPLEAVLSEFRDAGVDAELVIKEGNPGQVIIEYVLRTDADLVIVGKRVGKSHDVRRMGSVALYLARNSPGLVAVPKPGSKARPECIVAATDRSAVGERVVDVAASFASVSGARLHVIHAIQVGMEQQMEGEEASAAYVREERESVCAEVAEQLDDDLLRLIGYRTGAYALGYIDDVRDPLEAIRGTSGSMSFGDMAR